MSLPVQSASMPGQSGLFARAISLPGSMPRLSGCLPGLSPGIALPGQRHSLPGQSVCPGIALPRQSAIALSRSRRQARTPYPGSPGGSTPYPGSPPFKGVLAPPSFGGEDD